MRTIADLTLLAAWRLRPPDRPRREAPARVVLLSAARGDHEGDAAQRQDSREQVERTTRTLHVGANGELQLANVAGDIVVTAGGGNDVSVEIVKTARGRTDDDAQELLQLVQVESSSAADAPKSRLHTRRGRDAAQQSPQRQRLGRATT
jgi:phage terminase small subunit